MGRIEKTWFGVHACVHVVVFVCSLWYNIVLGIVFGIGIVFVCSLWYNIVLGIVFGICIVFAIGLKICVW